MNDFYLEPIALIGHDAVLNGGRLSDSPLYQLKTSRRSNFKHDIIADQVALEKHYNNLIKRRVAHQYKLV